jgi:hypothetical protein
VAEAENVAVMVVVPVETPLKQESGGADLTHPLGGCVGPTLSAR